MSCITHFPMTVSSILPFWLTIALLFIPPSSPTSDGDTLKQIIEKWTGSGNPSSTWTGNDPCQNWDGVQCEGANIVALNLSNKGLVGSVPSELTSLKSLVNLDLGNSKYSNGSWNRVSGDLSAISELTNLKSLNLSFNYINAEFPTSVLGLTALTDLRIDNAGLNGTFPSDWSKLTNLQYLYLGNNSMTGTLPSDVGSLTSMIEMSLWGNYLSSQIPDISSLTQLKYLNLHGCALYGGLPDSFQNLKNLQRLNLYNNTLTGPIPESWQKMSSLQDLRLSKNYLTKNFSLWLLSSTSLSYIDVSYNQFYGPVPNISDDKLNYLNIACNYFSGTQPTNLSQTNLTSYPNCFGTHATDDNRLICGFPNTCGEFNKGVVEANGCPSCPVVNGAQRLSNSSSCVCSIDNSQSGTSHSGIIIGVVIGAIAVLVLAVVGFLALKGRGYFQRDNSPKGQNINDKIFNKGGSQEYWEAPKGVERFSISDLEKATSGFSVDHEIGAGGFGKVFHGVLKNGKEVAIKRASGMQGWTEFRNEVMLLSRLHHRNLVRLEGFCEDNDLQILVYEYVPNGNLHRHLFQNTTSFGWLRRLDIAVGIAQGLDYLHSFADPPVIHRDVKPSNILLDNNMVAKVADFGISRTTLEFETHISTTPAGTAGYIDPQYFLRRQLTTASDVYSFGVLLLELVTGQKAIDLNRTEDHNLVEWVKMKMKVDGLNGIIDPRIIDDCPIPIYQDVANLAICCADFNKNERPHMNEALTILDSCLRAACPHPTRALSLEISKDLDSTIQILEEEAMPSKRRDVQQEEGSTGTFNSVLSANKSTFKSKFIIPR